ncbi:hypothetical protein JW926_09500 [Candidatus Sumerlaeota bacterium]|nr:hypothetical protein [Candidatus Sumerlaeota bacterium]
MNSETQIREYAHQLVDRMDTKRLAALLELVDEDYFSDEEVREIHSIRNSDEWSNWREVRSDV